MKYCGLISVVFACTVAVAGCTRSDNTAAQGNFRVKFTTDTALATRASADDITAPVTDSFDLVVKDASAVEVKRWSSISDYEPDTKFDAGNYTVIASCGNMRDEGFGKPCFRGEAECRILANQTTMVNLVATLANTAVAVSPTDAFKGYFTAYSVELVSSLGNSIPFVTDESRIAYVTPAPFKINVDYTRPDGKQGNAVITVNDVKPRTFYNVHLNVNNGEVGTAQITVSFDDSTQNENIDINIEEE